jgi:creatinine amidohydrolase
MKPRREVRWERMFPDELEAALEACPLAYLTYGLCEPHGPQSALGMDLLRPHAVACRAANLHGGIVAPPSWWNIHDYGIYSAWAHPLIGQARPWLTPIPPWLFFKNALYHVRAMDALGFRAAVLFTGHAGPHSEDLPRFVEIVQPHVSVRIAFVTDADLIPRELIGAFGHAGKVETSYLWAAEPGCVDMSRLPAPGDPGPHFAMGHDAPTASRRLGEEVIAAMADALAAVGRHLLAGSDGDGPAREAMTYEEVEALWDREFRPVMADFACMRDLRPGQPAPPEGSRWRRNWRVPERS